MKPKKEKKADINFIEGLCRTLETDYLTFKNVTLLGKRNEVADKPRPLKLVFEDDKSKGKCMRSLNKLGKAEPKYNKLTVVHDLTQKERQRNKKKWDECNEKNKELESGGSTFKYIMKGPPWDKRVAKIRK